ncbi:GIY-YIG nuclease family protein [Polaribacter ponticola]|uniref:GIY-YIG nuclease family protein n=1 Tax=Polaribacter ponticola TaxID=2978475 RepID=A0ABT5S7T2_9FLAO|nr:GIY-YIG nuclease family protein [Polaribacter sp. MSW5]MDD7914155.1 GIY-YIG nuclease family protein [Polaribacter sp. MSW5]
MNYYCYILSNKNRTVLYVGYTENLSRRVSEHKKGKGALFTKKYSVCELLYFEEFEDLKDARKREKQLKNWHKEWKWNLIKKSNPNLITLEIE